MKKKLLVLLTIIICIIAVGCEKKYKNEISIDCNGEKSSINIKENNKFKCELINGDYEFTIINIKDDKLTIKVSDRGLVIFKGGYLTGGNTDEFILKKDKELKLGTATEDYNEFVILNWK